MTGGAWWMDVLQAAGAVATAAGVFLAWEQLRAQRKQLSVDFEDRLAEQYRQVIGSIPIEAMLGSQTELSPDVLGAFYRYFDLTNEQIFLRDQKRISEETWKNWEEGIRMNMGRPAFEEAWRVVAGAVPDSFDELRALVPPLRNDPGR